MTEYNGHPSWEHWNVSLWVCNEEPLYRAAIEQPMEEFVNWIMDVMPETPDGAVLDPNLACYAWKDANDE